MPHCAIVAPVPNLALEEASLFLFAFWPLCAASSTLLFSSIAEGEGNPASLARGLVVVLSGVRPVVPPPAREPIEEDREWYGVAREEGLNEGG